jgi:antiviral helicase SKI2
VDAEKLIGKRLIAALNQTKDDVQAVLKEWLSSGSIPEVDWKKRIPSLDFQEIVRSRNETIQRLSTYRCKECPSFDDHVSVMALDFGIIS